MAIPNRMVILIILMAFFCCTASRRFADTPLHTTLFPGMSTWLPSMMKSICLRSSKGGIPCSFPLELLRLVDSI